MSDYLNSRLAFEKAIQFDSKFESMYDDKAKILFAKASSLYPYYRSEAIEAFKEALLFYPNNEEARITLAKLEKVEEAIKKTPATTLSHYSNCSCPECLSHWWRGGS